MNQKNIFIQTLYILKMAYQIIVPVTKSIRLSNPT